MNKSVTDYRDGTSDLPPEVPLRIVFECAKYASPIAHVVTRANRCCTWHFCAAAAALVASPAVYFTGSTAGPGTLALGMMAVAVLFGIAVRCVSDLLAASVWVDYCTRKALRNSLDEVDVLKKNLADQSG